MKDIYGISSLEPGEFKVFRYLEHYCDRRRISMVAHNTKRKYGWKFSVKTNGYNLTVRRIA